MICMILPAMPLSIFLALFLRLETSVFFVRVYSCVLVRFA